MKKLGKLRATLFPAARVLALVGFAGLLVLAILTTLDVTLRWAFAYPIHGVNDVSSVVMAVVIAACIPSNLINKQSISVEVLGNAVGHRGRLVIDAFASLCTTVFIVLMAWQFVPYAADLFGNGQRTWVLAWPVWPWWFSPRGASFWPQLCRHSWRWPTSARRSVAPPLQSPNLTAVFSESGLTPQELSERRETQWIRLSWHYLAL